MSLLERCERIVKAATSSGADHAEAYWEQGASLDVEIEKGALAVTSTAESQGGSIRVIKDGRVGFAYMTDERQMEAAIDRALQNARLMPTKPFAFPDAVPAPTLGPRWAESVAALDPAAVVQMARDVLDATADHEVNVVGGGTSHSWGAHALANSHGHAVEDRATETSAGLSLVIEGETTIAHWDSATDYLGKIDAHALGEQTAVTAASLRDPRPVEGGTMDCIFLPEAASEMLGNLIERAANGHDALRGKTVWSGKIGEEVASKALSIHDNPLRSTAIGPEPFDGEGRPARDIPIVADGVLETYLFDGMDAADHATDPTHSAVRGSFKDRPRTGAQHLVVGGDAYAMDKLLAGVDEGLLIGSVLGAHTANITTGDFSVTAPNVWRIEKGEVVGAAKEVALGGNLPALLLGVDGVSDAPREDGATVPAIRFRDVRISV